jgi:hypothetical protein
MRAIFEKYLNKAKENNKLVAIRTNIENADKFSVGYVLGLNDETISIKAINPQGLPDGIFTILTKDLYGIDLDDIYIRKLVIREKDYKKIFSDIPAPSFFSDFDVNISKILLKAIDSRQLININFYRDIGLYGFINEMNEEEFVIEVYNEDGEYDGTSVFLIEDIKNIIWDDENIRLIHILRKEKDTASDLF